MLVEREKTARAWLWARACASMSKRVGNCVLPWVRMSAREWAGGWVGDKHVNLRVQAFALCTSPTHKKTRSHRFRHSCPPVGARPLILSARRKRTSGHPSWRLQVLKGEARVAARISSCACWKWLVSAVAGSPRAGNFQNLTNYIRFSQWDVLNTFSRRRAVPVACRRF